MNCSRCGVSHTGGDVYSSLCENCKRIQEIDQRVAYTMAFDCRPSSVRQITKRYPLANQSYGRYVEDVTVLLGEIDRAHGTTPIQHQARAYGNVLR